LLITLQNGYYYYFLDLLFVFVILRE